MRGSAGGYARGNLKEVEMIKTGKLKVVLSVAKAIGCIIAGLVGFAGLYILWWVMAFIGLGIGLVSLWERKKRERDCG